MSEVAEHFVVEETWEILQLSIEGMDRLEVAMVPGTVPAEGTSKAMFLITNRFPRRVLDLAADAVFLERLPKVRLGAVRFRQTNLLPGEVTFGTVEIATEGAHPGNHGIGLSLSYRLDPAELAHGAGETGRTAA